MSTVQSIKEQIKSLNPTEQVEIADYVTTLKNTKKDIASDLSSLPTPVTDSDKAFIEKNKDLVHCIGEIGMDSPPLAPEERATLIGEKLEAAWHEGVDGVLVWSYRAGDGGNKDFDIHDPLASTLRRFSRTRHVRPDLR